MKLVVGLGNPGRRYERTRHNIGFEVAAELARRHGQTKARTRFKGEAVEATIEGDSVLVLCPHTFMNLSGASVQPARDFYQLTNDELLIVCDDFHLPLGRLRFRARGSAGGQKGMADIVRRLGGEDFPRLRIGIDPAPDGWDVADYVLSRFRKDEHVVILDTIDRAASAVADWVSHGTAYCMNQYNGT